MNISRNSKIITAIVALIIVFVGWQMYQAKNQNDNVIKLGGAFDLTGDASAWGEVAKNGAILAVDEINTHGGINGKQIQLISEDMHSTSEGSVSAVSKLLNVDNVAAIIGPTWLDVYQGAAPLVKNNNVLMITPDGGIEAINGEAVNRNVFSTWYRSDVKAKLIAQHMANAGVKRLAIAVQNDSFYSDFSGRVKKYAQQFGITVVDLELINSGTSDMRTVVLKIKSLQPDAVMIGLYDEEGLLGFLRARQQIDPQLVLYGDELLADFVNKEPYTSLLDGVEFFHATNAADAFNTAYKARFGSDPIYGAAPAYDATMIIAKALSDKGVGADFNDYLRQTTFRTVSYGDMTFDAIGGVKTANNQFDLKVLHAGVVKSIPW